MMIDRCAFPASGQITVNVTLTYSEALVRKSVRRFCGRTIGWLYPTLLLVMCAVIAQLVMDGDRSWFVGVVGTALLFGMIFPVVLYRNQLNGSLAKFRALQGRPVTFKGTESKIAIHADAGMSELPWAAITEVWQYPDCWILLFSRAHFMTFPLDGVPAEAKSFLLERVKAHGGRIR
jgi:hypothetical protein